MCHRHGFARFSMQTLPADHRNPILACCHGSAGASESAHCVLPLIQMTVGWGCQVRTGFGGEAEFVGASSQVTHGARVCKVRWTKTSRSTMRGFTASLPVFRSSGLRILSIFKGLGLKHVAGARILQLKGFASPSALSWPLSTHPLTHAKRLDP